MCAQGYFGFGYLDPKVGTGNPGHIRGLQTGLLNIHALAVIDQHQHQFIP